MFRVVIPLFAAAGLVGAALYLASPAGEPPPPTRRAVVSKGGMVVCVSPAAAGVGAGVLKGGGNAVDAAVAVAFVMAVTHPQAGNIGGGGFMMVHPGAGKRVVCVDYRETAPAASERDMFAGGVTRFDPRAVGVPGTVRGLALAHEKFGRVDWETLVRPAVKLAEGGFPLTAARAKSLNLVLASPRTPGAFTRTFGKPGGGPWREGDRLKQPVLAKTLRLIAEKGPGVFYTGAIAEKIASQMKRTGGLITSADLANYRAKIREPIHITYRGCDVYGPPPPSSGGVALAEMLNILKNFDLKKSGRWSARSNHLIIEAMRRAYADRAKHLGDADFVKIPPRLTTPDYGKGLAADIDAREATPSERLAGDIGLAGEGDSTTHFSIIDKDGMAVSNTYTIEASYGSRIVVEGAGFLLNNEMTDFNLRPGVTDRLGAIGTDANLPAPGKRMLSSMTPVIVLKDGEPFLITGSPGGRTIINTVACVVLNVLEFEMTPVEAVDAPRLHHPWFPDRVRFEGVKGHPKLVQQLRAMGHRVLGTLQGDAHTIWIDPETGERHGVADERIDGRAAAD